MYNYFNSVATVDSTHALAVGSTGQITTLTYNGSVWSATNITNTNNALGSIAAIDSSHALSAGASVVTAGTTHALAIGASGTIKALTYNGSTWSAATVTSGTTKDFVSIAIID